MTGALTWEALLPWAAGALGMIALFSLFRRPLRAAGRLLGRTGVGLALLAALAPVGELLGGALGVNLCNALVLGVLGAPGFGLLLMLKYILR